MKRTLLIAVAMVASAGCAVIDNLGRDDKPYENPFYAKYLNTGSQLDANIIRTLEAVRQNPNSPEAHNQLGALLVEKGFPQDAEREFEAAINAKSDYFPAWYNLGLVRAAAGNELGARRAFNNVVDLKPGHAAALFQLGLVEEKRHHRDRAVTLYAKAYSINPALMDVRVNPRILDSELTHLALLRMYPKEHTRRSMQFQGTPIPAAATGSATTSPQAPSQQQPAQTIVTPSAPVTDPSQQTTPTPPAAPRRTRRPATPPATTPAPAPAPPATNT